MTYVSPPDGDIDSGSPMTVALLTALRDNPKAIADGDLGAPRIRLPALGSTVAGDVVQWGVSAQRTVLPDSELIAGRFGFLQSGSVRVACETSFYGTVNLHRRRDGVDTVLATISVSAGWSLHSFDVAVLPGDFTYFRFDNAVSGYGYFRSLVYSTAGETLWPGAILDL